jgi:23S rRNA maturation-related 3'-5' exoribonuclease YhaM
MSKYDLTPEEETHLKIVKSIKKVWENGGQGPFRFTLEGPLIVDVFLQHLYALSHQLAESHAQLVEQHLELSHQDLAAKIRERYEDWKD